MNRAYGDVDEPRSGGAGIDEVADVGPAAKYISTRYSNT
jgi:hypothetical protein